MANARSPKRTQQEYTPKHKKEKYYKMYEKWKWIKIYRLVHEFFSAGNE